MPKITAKAYTNIGLIKYWGKRDKKLNLPSQESISITVDNLFTVTSVQFSNSYKEDIFILNGIVEEGIRRERVVRFLDIVRDLAKCKEKAKIISKNSFPTSAGLASSSSGFASLALASTKSLGLILDKRELSILARQGSGSACRSIYGGFVYWLKGETSYDSYSIQIAGPDFWDLNIISVIVDSSPKEISSTEGMNITSQTSPYYNAWINSNEEDIKDILQAIQKKDFTKLGEVTERNCLKMHGACLASSPSIIYFNPSTIEIIRTIRKWRKEGKFESYFTIDAGPNIFIISKKEDSIQIANLLWQLPNIKNIIISSIGKDAEIISEDDDE